MPSRDRDLRSDELRQSLQFLLDELYAQGELILPKEYMRALVSEHTREYEVTNVDEIKQHLSEDEQRDQKKAQTKEQLQQFITPPKGDQ